MLLSRFPDGAPVEGNARARARPAWLVRPIAHRGLHNANRGVIENTYSAVSAAMASGYAIEADVQEAADGAPVVFHDTTLDRLTTGSGPVSAQSAAALAGIPMRETDDRIMALADLLPLIDGAVPLIVEIKSDWRRSGRFEARIARQLAAYKGRVAVMSFDPHAMAAMAKEAPEIPRGLVAEKFTNARAWPRTSWAQRFAMRHLLSVAIARPHFVAYHLHDLPALAPLIARNAARLPLLTWTVRTGADVKKARRWADAMIFEGVRP